MPLDVRDSITLLICLTPNRRIDVQSERNAVGVIRKYHFIL
jgi:hypothetical protein